MVSANWRDRAACRGVDGDWMTYETNPGQKASISYQRLMKTFEIGVCEDCEVSGECLDYALSHDVRFGIWAGTTPGERRRMLRAQSVVGPGVRTSV